MKISYLKKSILCFLLVFALTIPLFGCNNILETPTDTPDEKTVIADFPDNYAIFKKNGQTYIDIANFEEYDIDRSGWDYILMLQFKDANDMYNSFMTGNLEKHDKMVLAGDFPKDENGVKFWDFDNFYVPKTPEKYKITNLTFVDSTCIDYSIHAFYKDPKDYCWVSIELFDSELTQELFENEFDEIKNQVSSGTAEISDLFNSCQIVYSEDIKGRFDDVTNKYICYFLQDNEKIMFVKEEYRVFCSDDTIFVSDTLPLQTTIYAIQDDVCFEMTVTTRNLSERPNPSWYLNFGVEKFVPEK